jgi:flagellar export protein FliJ
MSARHPEDRALNAVRRVRDSREQDSRSGLTRALSVVDAREAELRRAAAQRAEAARFAVGSPADFAAHVGLGAGMATHERQAADRVRDSRLVADEAVRRWQLDRQQVRAVDVLLERRAEARAQDRARREARELDDLATQSWLRNNPQAVTP